MVNDGKIRGIVIKLSSVRFKRIAPCPDVLLYKAGSFAVGRREPAQLRRRRANQRLINVGAGVSLTRLVSYARRFGLSGCELLAGIPGTVGGALVMNAGGIGNSVFDVLVMDRSGRITTLKNKDIQFGYRSSNLSRYVILGVRLKFVKKSKTAIEKSINEYLIHRRKTQDLSFPSAGCVFKNPNSKPAAYLIERCGLKGLSFGDAAVSNKHANFIINKGRARFRDIKRLMAHIAGQVRKRFNIILEPEIKIWYR